MTLNIPERLKKGATANKKSTTGSSNLNTIIKYIDDLDFGIRAEFIEVLVSKK